MKGMKKALALALVVAVTSAASIAGTLAYLTDRDSEANVFAVGNVDIALTEDFAQGSTLMPGVTIEKKPAIANTGKNDAWVWATIAFPSKLDNDDASKNVVHFNYSAEDVNDTEWTWKDAEGNWNISKVTFGEGDAAKEYNVYTVLYQTALKPGTETPAVMTQVYMDPHVDIDPDGDWYHVEAGVAEKLDWNSNEDGNPVIYVSAYAIQTEGFEDVYAAYAAYTDQWTTTDGVNNGLEWGTPATVAATADELVAALEEGEDVVLTNNVTVPANASNAYGKTGINVKNGQTIDGGGKTISVPEANSTWDSAISTTGGTIKNITINQGFRGIFINHNSDHSEPVVLENVIIDGPVYTISCDQGKNQGLTATDSTFNGWTSYAATTGDVSFTNCNFGEGAGYAYCRPYAPTSFVGCDFEEGFEVDPRAAVTFENCTIGGVVALTADNLATLVTSNITNATVK